MGSAQAPSMSSRSVAKTSGVHPHGYSSSDTAAATDEKRMQGRDTIGVERGEMHTGHAALRGAEEHGLLQPESVHDSLQICGAILDGEAVYAGSDSPVPLRSKRTTRLKAAIRS